MQIKIKFCYLCLQYLNFIYSYHNKAKNPVELDNKPGAGFI